METSSRSWLAGLMTKSTAPARIALMAASMGAMRSLDDDGRHARQGADTVEHGHAVGSRHYEIEQHQGDARTISAFQDVQGLLAALGGLVLVPEAFDGLFENAALGRIVVND